MRIQTSKAAAAAIMAAAALMTVLPVTSRGRHLARQSRYRRDHAYLADPMHRRQSGP